jgi:hypothetical protein
LPFRLPKRWSSCERSVQSSWRSSVVPLMPPVAVCSMSMCVLPASSVYCLQCSVTVANEMALRVIQLMPWRARTASVSSERVLFCLVLVCGCGPGQLKALNEMIFPGTYHHPLAGEVFQRNFWWCCHGCDMMFQLLWRGSFIVTN